MFPSASLLALGGTLLWTVADKVPALDVESSCRAAAKMGDSLSLDATLRQCLADEKSARDELEKQWTQFPAADPIFEQDAGQYGSVQADPVRAGGIGQRAGKIPREVLDSEDGRFLQSVADRNVYQIVHLIYRSKNYEVQSKDYEFSRNSMIDHWNAGYNDGIRTLRHPEALQRPTDQTGVATFDVAVDGRE